MKIKGLLMALILMGIQATGQNPPWERPLRMAWSADGIQFGTPVTFQDSSGVPSLIRWKGDTLACAFQWFRQPIGSASWDRVAVRFSFDNGQTWNLPVPLVFSGMPAQFQRPFDPTLLVLPDGRLRLFFSSSPTLPQPGQDSIINTYSAVSTDGIQFSFEPGARVDYPSKKVIDPAVIRFRTGYHFAAPAGAPQDGAFHYVSPDGFNFSSVPVIPSDPQHNWTGNFMVNDTNELRFYGGGPGSIWFNRSPNGGQWLGYTATNITGGDPAVLKTGQNEYLMIFVGPSYLTNSAGIHSTSFRIYPNPANRFLFLGEPGEPNEHFRIVSLAGVLEKEGIRDSQILPIEELNPGWHCLEIRTRNHKMRQKIPFLKH